MISTAGTLAASDTKNYIGELFTAPEATVALACGGLRMPGLGMSSGTTGFEQADLAAIAEIGTPRPYCPAQAT